MLLFPLYFLIQLFLFYFLFFSSKVKGSTPICDLQRTERLTRWRGGWMAYEGVVVTVVVVVVVTAVEGTWVYGSGGG